MSDNAVKGGGGLTLSPDEVERLTGGYKRAADQLRELHRLGFYRARLGRITREVILERAHVDAVATGQVEAVTGLRSRPKLRSAT